MKPRLIDSIIAADGSVYDECKPQEVCRVMSESTARALRGALESVTEKKGPAGRGTATQAAIPGFRVGGKTGTAKKVSSSGKYFDNLYTVSFAGIFPIDDPRLVVMTVIDEPHPRDCNAGGGTVAAPIFRAAAERFINVLNIQPSDPEAYEKYLAEQQTQASTQK
jgi:cell division protein FtsI (penicillin-binding protein 3)